MAPSNIPTSAKALELIASPAGKTPPYHGTKIVDRPLPELKPGEVLVQLNAAAFNHRELWIRKGLYPGIVIGSILGADGAGRVIATGDPADTLLDKRVFLTPMRGWDSHPEAPESAFTILGGGIVNGTFTEYIVVERDQVVLTPDHLDDVQAAAWPLSGLTAWRATVINAEVKSGENVLITGIGGGVAILALQIAVAIGANVYVTSGSEEKIKKAIALGAKGGANYKDEKWPSVIRNLLRQNGQTAIDSVIDSSGGDIVSQAGQVLRAGGKFVAYGMTVQPKVTFTMREVVKSQRFIGSTMGSRKDMIDATNFLASHRIVPTVSHVLDGLESAEEGFELMKKSDQFGKIVINIRSESGAKQRL